jgi:hypothetical protein
VRLKFPGFIGLTFQGLDNESGGTLFVLLWYGSNETLDRALFGVEFV